MEKWSKKIRKILRGVGLVFAYIAFLVAFFFFASWAAGEIRELVESRIRERIVSRIVEESGVTEGYTAEEKLLSLSFTDIFSGTGWINSNKTTLYHDDGADMFTFPPQANGFDKSEPREVVSVSIKRHPVQVQEAVIAEAGLSGDGARVEFYLSKDGERWHKVDVGEWLTFPEREGYQLLWRARFTPDNNPYTSPIFSSIRLHYKAKFL